MQDKKKKKVGRNDPCPCGSGQKYKKCCLQKQQSSKLPKVANQHIIDEDAQRIFKTTFNRRNGFLVSTLTEDYGIDYLVELIDDQDQASGISFYVQLKGTEKIEVKSNHIALSLKKSTLNLFSKNLIPTFVVLIDVTNQQGYWHNCFDAIDELNQRSPLWLSESGKTTTIHIPKNQYLSGKELTKLRQYVQSVHSRRMAIPQGSLVLMQPFDSDGVTLKLEDLTKIVESHDYKNFFQVILENPFYYLSDLNFSKLYDLFEQIPPKNIYADSNVMAMLGLSAMKKGFYQEAKKWFQLAIDGKASNIELLTYADLLSNEINFMYGYISEDDFSASLERLIKKASPDIKANISLRQFTLDYTRKEREARQYGRFRQMDLMKTTIKKLKEFSESYEDSIKELILLEIVHNYIVLVPSLWGEISARMNLRQRVNLKLTREEVEEMEKEANEATEEAYKMFNILIGNSNHHQVSIETRAEALLSYSMLIYHLQTINLNSYIFLKDSFVLPEQIPLSADEELKIEKALKFCIEARDLFKKIGSSDREATALIYIMGYYEDLGREQDYKKTKKELENIIKLVCMPNTIELYKKSIKEGSFRKQVFSGIRNREQSTDFSKANMNQADIEMQVDCHCKTFNITDENRINNVRKDVISSKLAADFRIRICKHFLLLQDMQHSFSLDTSYNINPNRKGLCKRLNHESQIINNDTKAIINTFKKTYCDKCRFSSPLEKQDE